MKKYWKDIDAKEESGQALMPDVPVRGNALLSMFADQKDEGSASRRDFLKLCGFSLAVTAMASCQSKVRKVVPYVVAPYEITPGEANYYASSLISGSDYCSIVVKTREGRPIKIEGNPESGITRGGTNARGQASILELYDTSRYQAPLMDGVSVEWDMADAEIVQELKKISDRGGSIVMLTPSIFSPSTQAVIEQFQASYPGTEWIPYDAVSASAIREANRLRFGKELVPDYRFDVADVIVSVGADFLGTWLSPVEYTRQFSSRRNPDQEMNHLIQIESNLSLTGSNADRRIQIKPSQEGIVLLNIYKEIVGATEQTKVKAPPSPVDVKELSKKLLQAKGKSLLVASSNDVGIQQLVCEINRALGNIGTTLQWESPLMTYQGRDSDMKELIRRMNAGEIDALLTYHVNPAYTRHDAEDFVKGVEKVGLIVSLSHTPDETSTLAKYVCPDNHYLESWNDAEAKKHKYSLAQPVVQAIFNTRQFQDSLLLWSGSEQNYYDFMNALWAERFMPLQSEHFNPEAFFDHSLQKGVFEPAISIPVSESAPEADAMEEAVSERLPFDPSSLGIEEGSGEGVTEVVLYESLALGVGNQANNPWLQELPDPLTRICWDNVACISPAQASGLGFNSGDLIKIDGIEIPVYIQPGQAYGTVGVALGYGRSVCGLVGKGVGTNVWPFSSEKNSNTKLWGVVDELVPTGSQVMLAQTQTHHSMEGRELVRESDKVSYTKDPTTGNEMHTHFQEHAKSLYPEREFPNHHWGMAIDLSTCTGCANCVIACQAENNIPVVGKEEVTRVHEMHWMRIDRYFSGDENDPQVVFQPVMCQHCDNAPCENVCPVAATNQSSEGLNQMVYNRCIGTRYCNNNCPYKVRRFNWFNYTEAGTLGGNLRDSASMTQDMRRMVLNPDVTVRSQGVIEKCSMCVQRIQSAKLTAKAESRALSDDEMQTACSQSCPANSIIFGDMNDSSSEISKLISSGRRYNLLEEIYTKPSVHYLTKIRNT
jgi:Fe-S-cluster-containing dehydrogenase component/anaerobic selenocysteine-containing dehydrogenase